MKSSKILCLDFDGVIHQYTSGWRGACVIPDPPVDGALKFIADTIKKFDVHIFSSRSGHEGGVNAMKQWLESSYIEDGWPVLWSRNLVHTHIVWPAQKPPAFLTIDDRAWTFTGEWPSPETIDEFLPWYQRSEDKQQ